MVFWRKIFQLHLNYGTKGYRYWDYSKVSTISPKLKDRFKKGKNWIDLDRSIYEPIKQGITILKHGNKNRDVSLFFSFIFSKNAQDIFKKFGY